MRAEKQLLLEDLKSKIEKSPTLLVTRYERMSANNANAFRKEVRKTGGDFEIVGKRMLFKAAQAAGMALDLNFLEGHIGVVFSGKDPLKTTKAVVQFGADQEQKVQVILGRFDGQMHSREGIELLSKLPDINTMRAQFLGLLAAPMAQLVSVLSAQLSAVPLCLEQRAKKLS